MTLVASPGVCEYCVEEVSFTYGVLCRAARASVLLFEPFLTRCSTHTNSSNRKGRTSQNERHRQTHTFVWMTWLGWESAMECGCVLTSKLPARPCQSKSRGTHKTASPMRVLTGSNQSTNHSLDVPSPKTLMHTHTHIHTHTRVFPSPPLSWPVGAARRQIVDRGTECLTVLTVSPSTGHTISSPISWQCAA